MTQAICHSGIYAITHAADGRAYVGSAKNLKKREGQHLRLLAAGKHHSTKLQNAWNKYGAQAFCFSVLEYVPDVTLLVLREQEWIDGKQAATHGFNVSAKAGSLLGFKHSETTKDQMSLAHKGRVKTPEHAAKVASALRGRTMTDEQRQKMRDAKLGKKRKPHSEETKARMSAASKGKPKSPEHRAALSLAKVGKQLPMETRLKMSAAHRAIRQAQSQTQPTQETS